MKFDIVMNWSRWTPEHIIANPSGMYCIFHTRWVYDSFKRLFQLKRLTSQSQNSMDRLPGLQYVAEMEQPKQVCSYIFLCKPLGHGKCISSDLLNKQVRSFLFFMNSSEARASRDHVLKKIFLFFCLQTFMNCGVDNQ